jgi:hypothetical protein
MTALALATGSGGAVSARAPDTLPPVTAPPTATPRLGAAVGALTPFTIAWPAAVDPGGSGVAAYQLRQRVDGGSWERVRLTSTTARSIVLRLRPPHDIRLAVRAVDRAGNVGAWAEAPAFRQRLLGETTPGLVPSSGWTLRASHDDLGGRALRSGLPGATATFSFTGSRVAWIARRGPNRGTAVVSIDGTRVAAVDLHRAVVRHRRIVFRWAWPASGPHTLTIRVAGTAGHPYVDVDGFVVADEPPGDPVLVGAGDVTHCSLTGDTKTAALLDRIAGTVFVAGDVAYPDGTAAQLRDCYGPTWGRWRLRTHPVPGNHDYRKAGAAPYYAYFGSRAGPAGVGWYAYDLGAWRVYGLNSNCAEVGGCGPGSEQERWLRADLAANPRRCVAAVWHHPLFSSGYHGGNAEVRPLWRALEEAGAEIVLAGHDHDYERFAPQTAAGATAPSGIREFVVGTGGAALRPFDAILPNSERRSASSHGVLKLTLRADGYDWAFVPVAGSVFTDAGSGSCH